MEWRRCMTSATRRTAAHLDIEESLHGATGVPHPPTRCAAKEEIYMNRVFRLTTLATLGALASCSASDDAPVTSGGQGAISDAVHGGTPGFAFLPPMVPNPR